MNEVASMADVADDAVLAAGAVAGDAESFGVLFDRYAQTVYRFCWRHVPDPGLGVDAEDLMSVVFLEAWAARSRLLVVDGSVRPWLLGVAANVVRNQRRSLRRHRAAMGRLPALDPGAGHAEGVDAQVDAAAALRRALDALGQLSAKEREAIELCVLEGLEPDVAARLLGVPCGTVKSRLARARARMRTLSQTGDFADPTTATGHQQGEREDRAPVRGGAAWIR